MVTRLLSALVALMLIGSALTLGQDAKKAEAKEASEEVGQLKEFSCGDPCNFAIHSRDDQEVIDASIAHMKKHHNTVMTPADVRAKMTVAGKTQKSEAKKEEPKG